LSLEGDRILRGVAMVELRDTPLPVLAEMFVRKAIAFLFVTSAEPSGGVTVLRSWRILLFVFAAAAIVLQWRTRVVATLTAFVVYMVLVHLPALYNHRYSVGALDVPLAILAAIGLAECLRKPAHFALAAAVAVLGIAAGVMQHLFAAPGEPRIDRSPVELIWSKDIRDIHDLRLENATRTAPSNFELAPGAAIEIPVTNAPKFHPWDFSMTTLNLAIKPQARLSGCTALRLRYKKSADERYAEGRVVRIPVQADGRMHAITVGTTVPLAINHEGVLRIEFECAYPAALEMGTISIAAPRRAFHYRDRYLEQQKASARERK
jgi:hypothetical protein